MKLLVFFLVDVLDALVAFIFALFLVFPGRSAVSDGSVVVVVAVDRFDVIVEVLAVDKLDVIVEVSAVNELDVIVEVSAVNKLDVIVEVSRL